MKKRKFNARIFIVILVIIALIAEISILLYIAKNGKNKEELNNNYILNDFDEISKYEIQEQEEAFKKEVNDKNTLRYSIIESSDDTISLEYAYVTNKYTKIKLSYNIEKIENYDNLSEEEKENIQTKELEKIEYEEKAGYPYIETSKGKKIIPNRTDDSDGGRLVSVDGNCEWYDTFPLTAKDVTEELILYFINENNKEIKIKLIKEKWTKETWFSLLRGLRK